MFYERKFIISLFGVTIFLSFVLLYSMDLSWGKNIISGEVLKKSNNPCKHQEECAESAEDKLLQDWKSKIEQDQRTKEATHQDKNIGKQKSSGENSDHFLPPQFDMSKKDFPNDYMEDWILGDFESDPEPKAPVWTDEIAEMLNENKDLKPLSEALTKQDGKFYDQNDPELIQIIKDKYLLPPSDLPYELDFPEKENSMGQSQAIIKILKNQTNGFFVECGGFDGETRSNTLTLEKKFGWKGVLVEADLHNLVQLKQKHRKAWAVPACLSTANHTMYVSFRAWGHIGKIVSDDLLKNKVHQTKGPEGESPDRMVNATCLPLFSIMQAMNIDTIDYFSLDVEGHELHILKTIPFDKIKIRTLSVEFSHASESGASKEALESFMRSQGYFIHSLVIDPNFLAHDFIFIDKTIKDQISKETEERKREKIESMKKLRQKQ